jgi:hypothetical protein
VRIPSKIPYWVVVDDDPNANDVTVFPLEPGETTFGRIKRDIDEDISESTQDGSRNHGFVLNYPGITGVHCIVTNESEIDAFEIIACHFITFYSDPGSM